MRLKILNWNEKELTQYKELERITSTCMSVEPTWAERCARSNILFDYWRLSLNPATLGAPLNLAIKFTILKGRDILLRFSENPVILASAVLSQYTRVTYDIKSYENCLTLQCSCNVWLTAERINHAKQSENGNTR